jgi:pimeloyl-ACP methyl ester carboxylesterase
MSTTRLILSYSCLLLSVACTSDKARLTGRDAGDRGSPSKESGAATASCDVVVKDTDCDKSLRPFVFVHGTFGAGNNFAHVASLMTSNGWCPDRIVGVEYDSIPNPANQDYPGLNCVTAEDASAPPKGCGKIDEVVDAILKKNPDFTQVDIAGHSQGTKHVGLYLADPDHAKKIAHYINFSGVPDVGDVKTLSLSSMHDLGGSPHHATGKNVTEFTLTDEDHFAVAASTRSFVQVYKYLVGKDPKYTEIQCGDEMVDIEGIAETFADNWPVTGKVEIRKVGAARAEGAPLQTIRGDATGHFGPIQLERGVAYEFKGFDDADKLVGYSYFTPFMRSNRLVRLLIPPHDPAIAAASTDKVTPVGKGYSALLAQWSGGAFRYDLGASLKVDGEEVLTDENAGNKALMTPSLNGGVVGFFMWDKNQNGQSDLGLVDSTSFIAYTDVFVDATTPKLVKLSFTPGSEDTATAASSEATISNYPSENNVLISLTFQ